jgi:hypothetical protein
MKAFRIRHVVFKLSLVPLQYFLQYGNIATASLPFAVASAQAVPNDLGVYRGVGAISNDPIGGPSNNISALAYATDRLYLTGVPTEGYVLIPVSVLGYILLANDPWE